MKCNTCDNSKTLFRSKVSNGSFICEKCYDVKCRGYNCITEEKPYYKNHVITGGTLFVEGSKECLLPLKHTEVKANIIGMLAEVEVTQKFRNSFHKNIEAIYVFPLPHDGAVNFLEITAGNKVIEGVIKEREEAKKTYEEAKSEGRKAGLLEQERPNLFTMSVANIEASEEILVKLKYHETLKYEEGEYEFTFPVTLTPRYNSPVVSDRERISPPVQVPGKNNKREISIHINLDGGFEIEKLESPTHLLYIQDRGKSKKEIQLAVEGEIPNKDFILKYSPKGDREEKSISFYREEGNVGTFMLNLTPKFDYGPEEILKREIIFVLDRSGSMDGSPMEHARKALLSALKTLRGGDMFNVIAFDDAVDVLSEKSLIFNDVNLLLAESFICTIYARGNTNILMAMEKALSIPESKEHLRQIVFLTDGAVGCEEYVLKEIEKKMGTARIFTFGIGPAVNRYLLDKMAKTGRGTAQFISGSEEIENAMEKFSRHTSFPILTNIVLEWENLIAADTYPSPVPDLYFGETLNLFGRFHSSGKGKAIFKCKTRAGDFIEEIEVDMPEKDMEHPVIETIWAKKRIDFLLDRIREKPKEKHSIRDEIIGIALKYKLLTPYTSFVAVDKDEKDREKTQDLLTVNVPSLMPDGLQQPYIPLPVQPVAHSGISTLCYSRHPVNSSANYSASHRGGAGEFFLKGIGMSASIVGGIFCPLMPQDPEAQLDAMPGKQMAVSLSPEELEERERQRELIRKFYRPGLMQRAIQNLGLLAALLFTIILFPFVLIFSIPGKIFEVIKGLFKKPEVQGTKTGNVY